MNYSKAKTVIYRGPCGNYEFYTGEARNARYLDNVNEKWERPGWFNVGRAVRYRPDLYLPRLNLYIEVKNLNAEDLLSDPIAIEKMRMFYEKGYDLYCVDGMPVTDAAFAYQKYCDSGHIFFSNRFIHPDSPLRQTLDESFALFNKHNDQLWLMNATDRTSIDYFFEAYEACKKDFNWEEIS